MRRNKEIKVRFTEKEYEVLVEKVRKSGISREKYMRALVAGMEFKELPPIDYYKLVNEWNAVGNNLNQLVKQTHIYKSVNEKMCNEILQDFKSMIANIDEVVRGK